MTDRRRATQGTFHAHLGLRGGVDVFETLMARCINVVKVSLLGKVGVASYKP